MRADPTIGTTAELLVGLALLAEGSDLPDPGVFTAQVTNLLARHLASTASSSTTS